LMIRYERTKIFLRSSGCPTNLVELRIEMDDIEIFQMCVDEDAIPTSNKRKSARITNDSKIATTATLRSMIEITEDTAPGCGGRVWESANVLCSYLDKLKQNWFEHVDIDFDRNKCGLNVLELGAGTGVVGIYMAKLFGFNCQTQPDHVQSVPSTPHINQLILTDMDFLCPLMIENVQKNDLNNYLLSAQISVKPLLWGCENLPSPRTLTASASSKTTITDYNLDIVLISDCVYLETCFDILLETMDALIGAHTVCFMSYKKRRRAEKQFFIKLRKLFDVHTVFYFSFYNALLYAGLILLDF
jgi:predicted nicotinamide N-methyase